MTETPRRGGRPATGKTPTRSVRIGDVWDRARAIAEQRGTTITAVIEHALEDYVMDATTIPALSDGTRAAVANVVEYTIEKEYGQQVPGLAGAKQIALAGLQFDLLAGGAPQDGIQGHADIVLRMLVTEGLAARVCQCRQLHPHGCPHGSTSGQLWCGRHYEADVPELGRALLCGTCHVVEYESRS